MRALEQDCELRIIQHLYLGYINLKIGATLCHEKLRNSLEDLPHKTQLIMKQRSPAPFIAEICSNAINNPAFRYNAKQSVFQTKIHSGRCLDTCRGESCSCCTFKTRSYLYYSKLLVSMLNRSHHSSSYFKNSKVNLDFM